MATDTDQPTAVPQVTLELIGMHCAACVTAVEQALQSVPGVQNAAVNLATGRARVVMAAPDAVGGEALVAAVRRAGYEARVLSHPGVVRVESRAADEAAASWGRLGLAAALGLPVILWHMAMAIPAVHHWAARVLPFEPHGLGAGLAQGALAAAATAVGAGAMLGGAWRALRVGRANMDLLVSIGAVSALAAGGLGLLLNDAGLVVLFESAVMIVLFVALGKQLEAGARRRAAGALNALASRVPNEALLITPDGVRRVPTAEIRRGARVRLAADLLVPTDAVVRSGEVMVDESLLTGESAAIRKSPGDRVLGGARVIEGTADVESTAEGRESAAARIAAMVTDAQATKAPIQRLADRVAAWFVPAVLLIAAATLMGWWLAGATPTAAFLRALTVVVVACPCALGLAVPTAVLVGTTRAAEQGILIRDAAALEALAGVRSVLLDKTGTLTAGRPRVVEAWIADGVAKDELISAAAGLATLSQHPASEAVAAWAGQHGTAAAVADFASAPGGGLRGSIGGVVWRLGRREWLARHGVADSADARWADLADQAGAPRARAARASEAEDGSQVWLARGGEAAARFVLRDEPLAEAEEAVRSLGAMGLRVRILSGDRTAAVARLAQRVGVSEFEAELSPQDKLERVRVLSSEGAAMVGDGINDAPALAAATVGMAIGAGADLARESAAVCLLGRAPGLIPAAVRAARTIRAMIRQNLAWATGYNLVMLPAAMLSGLRPEWAAAAMMLSSLSVVGNSLRLRRLI